MLIDTVRQTIREHDLIHKGDHIILGLSGGPDSTCLFHVLLRLAGEFALTIHPVHVNHLFRPGDAERDHLSETGEVGDHVFPAQSVGCVCL